MMSIDFSNEYLCSLTKEMDEHLKDEKLKEYYSTYIYLTEKDVEEVEAKDKKIMALRFPGATIGCIKIDDDFIIKDIVLYEDISFDPFKSSVKEAIKKYIGRKIKIIKL
ncbi:MULTISPECIES: hypothetical protein [Bacteria]|uniref:hypothetical protein n=1 Tax=Bacteria TaxID=2 RepID=UPI003F4173D6